MLKLAQLFIIILINVWVKRIYPYTTNSNFLFRYGSIPECQFAVPLSSLTLEINIIGLELLPIIVRFNNGQLIALTWIFHFTCIHDDVRIIIQHISYSFSLYLLCISNTSIDVIVMFDYVLCLRNSFNFSLLYLYLLI